MQTQILRRAFVLSIAAFLTTLSNPAVAGDVVTKKLNDGVSTSSTATTYWTPERFRNAKARPLPKHTSTSTGTAATPTTETSVSASGQPPTVNATPNTQKLFTSPKPVDSTNNDKVQANKVGTAGAYFTSSRLIPLSADTAYPYRTVGKLFFTEPGVGDFVCSASVIRPRVVLTAGHCVHSGSGGSSGFFTNFVFIPAYRNGSAPYYSWSPSLVSTTTAWVTSNGNFPNAADYAMFEMPDKSINGSARKIGDITGYLGYRTQGLLPNHATLLGYPGNLDNGEIIHQVTAESFRSRSPNAVEYGSDMGGGSSGGPWIQNFGALAAGQGGGSNSGLNQVVGVTSYGPVSTAPLYAGSSILDSRFINLLDTICTNRAGNC